MKTIELTNSKRVAHIDDEFWPLIARYNWQLSSDGRYAVSTIDGKNVSMHRLITNPPIGCDIDHINGDGLYNLCVNMRVATRSQNKANSEKYSGEFTSKYKGVCFISRRRVFIAQAYKNKKRYVGGYFHDEIEAARAYDKLAKKLHGEFAKLNFPESNVKEIA
jgi:hypothetical protein